MSASTTLSKLNVDDPETWGSLSTLTAHDWEEQPFFSTTPQDEAPIAGFDEPDETSAFAETFADYADY